ncbi:MAG TPA: hypothetical protein VN815_12465, partial [Steroidobacteraceae bacterium]|nr:hypothetical protein [Steroidobacteraceae bacterium]
MKATFHLLALACLWMPVPALSYSQAPALLHEMFQDHAVLQRDEPIPVWGESAAGDRITVSLAESRVETRADAGGHWHALLPAMKAGGPHTLEVRAQSGRMQAVADIFVGDVFLCSGQSNMELPVARSLSAEAEIAAATHDTLRLLSIAHDNAASPLNHFLSPVAWIAASPETVANFSAACYYFA